MCAEAIERNPDKVPDLKGSDRQEREPTLKELREEMRQGFKNIADAINALTAQLGNVGREPEQVGKDKPTVVKSIGEIAEEIDTIRQTLQNREDKEGN